MTDCRKCGFPLNKGNIKVIRKKGKRPHREHRRCPEPKPMVVTPFTITSPPTDAIPDQRPQNKNLNDILVNAVNDYEEPPKYRYFMTQGQAERLRENIEQRILIPGFGIGFEVIPVPKDEIERNPEQYAGLVEVKVDWKVGN